jgi:hypothetical protein
VPFSSIASRRSLCVPPDGSEKGRSALGSKKTGSSPLGKRPNLCANANRMAISPFPSNSVRPCRRRCILLAIAKHPSPQRICLFRATIVPSANDNRGIGVVGANCNVDCDESEAISSHPKSAFWRFASHAESKVKNQIAVKPRQIHVAPTKKARQYGEPLLFQTKET